MHFFIFIQNQWSNRTEPVLESYVPSRKERYFTITTWMPLINLQIVTIIECDLDILQPINYIKAIFVCVPNTPGAVFQNN